MVSIKNKNEYRVFLSHTTKDDFIIQSFVKPAVEKAGAVPFVDNEIEIGSDFRNTVLDELHRFDEIIILLTQESIKKKWVIAELGVAAFREFSDETKMIIPVVYGVSKQKLNKLNILTIIGNRQLINLEDLTLYRKQLRKRVIERGI